MTSATKGLALKDPLAPFDRLSADGNGIRHSGTLYLIGRDTLASHAESLAI